MKTATTASVKKWCGAAPEKCDICEQPIQNVFVDGRTQFGFWANCCPTCFVLYGTGLGTGSGQQYEKQGDQFVKVKG